MWFANRKDKQAKCAFVRRRRRRAGSGPLSESARVRGAVLNHRGGSEEAGEAIDKGRFDQ